MTGSWIVERHDGFHVCRDDLVAGGTKRRGLERLLKTTPEKNLVYAGTVFGHGALALAYACRDLGKQAHLFLACNDPDHPVLDELTEANAAIHMADPLPVEHLYQNALAWQALSDDSKLFPLAFDAPDFHDAMAGVLQSFDSSPYPEIWCASVSGTFARCLKDAFPKTPLRIVSTVRQDGAEFLAPEKYHQPAKAPPPYPSCPHTDAKVWQFAQKHAKQGALIWNIAG